MFMAPESPVTVATSLERNQFIMTFNALSHAREAPKLTITRPMYSTPKVGASPIMTLPAVVSTRPKVMVLRGPIVSANVPDGSCIAAYT